MANPVATTRQTPSGIKLEDGYQTLITFAADPDVSFWEQTVQPPGMDGGDPIDTTTMHNSVWRTYSPRQLVTLSGGKATVAYDPGVYSQILALINVQTTITITFPDGSTIAFYGFLRSFTPAENQEGEMPTAEVQFVATNYDPNNKVEAGPTVTSVAGT